MKIILDLSKHGTPFWPFQSTPFGPTLITPDEDLMFEVEKTVSKLMIGVFQAMFYVHLKQKPLTMF